MVVMPYVIAVWALTDFYLPDVQHNSDVQGRTGGTARAGVHQGQQDTVPHLTRYVEECSYAEEHEEQKPGFWSWARESSYSQSSRYVQFVHSPSPYFSVELENSSLPLRRLSSRKWKDYWFIQCSSVFYLTVGVRTQIVPITWVCNTDSTII